MSSINDMITRRRIQKSDSSQPDRDTEFVNQFMKAESVEKSAINKAGFLEGQDPEELNLPNSNQKYRGYGSLSSEDRKTRPWMTPPAGRLRLNSQQMSERYGIDTSGDAPGTVYKLPFVSEDMNDTIHDGVPFLGEVNDTMVRDSLGHQGVVDELYAMEAEKREPKPGYVKRTKGDKLLPLKTSIRNTYPGHDGSNNLREFEYMERDKKNKEKEKESGDSEDSGEKTSSKKASAQDPVLEALMRQRYGSSFFKTKFEDLNEDEQKKLAGQYGAEAIGSKVADRKKKAEESEESDKPTKKSAINKIANKETGPYLRQLRDDIAPPSIRSTAQAAISQDEADSKQLEGEYSDRAASHYAGKDSMNRVMDQTGLNKDELRNSIGEDAFDEAIQQGNREYLDRYNELKPESTWDKHPNWPKHIRNDPIVNSIHNQVQRHELNSDSKLMEARAKTSYARGQKQALRPTHQIGRLNPERRPKEDSGDSEEKTSSKKASASDPLLEALMYQRYGIMKYQKTLDGDALLNNKINPDGSITETPVYPVTGLKEKPKEEKNESAADVSDRVAAHPGQKTLEGEPAYPREKLPPS